MDKAAFWKLIDASRENAGGDLDEQVADLRARVEKLDPNEIIKFGKQFDEYWGRAYTWDLWAAAWIGCVLPLVSGTDSPQFGGASRGVVSRKPTKAFAGYGVPAREALLILEQHDAAAARWWREQAPRLLQPGKVLVFAADVCELLDE